MQCFNMGEGEIGWGGVDRIGTVGSFYVTINGRPPRNEMDALRLANVTADSSLE